MYSSKGNRRQPAPPGALALPSFYWARFRLPLNTVVLSRAWVPSPRQSHHMYSIKVKNMHAKDQEFHRNFDRAYYGLTTTSS